MCKIKREKSGISGGLIPHPQEFILMLVAQPYNSPLNLLGVPHAKGYR